MSEEVNISLEVNPIVIDLVIDEIITVEVDRGVGPRGEKGDTGDQGPIGDTGPKGDPGDTGSQGNGISSIARTSGTGAAGTTDTYTITFTNSTTTTFQVVNGANGSNGADGSVWRSGSGAPSNGLGANGDYYLNTSNSDVYYKSSGTYSVVTNIKGATGATGSTGATGAAGSNGTNGTNGASFLSGSGVPSSGTGANGDSYLDYSTNIFYTKSGGAWTSQGPLGKQRLLYVNPSAISAPNDTNNNNLLAYSIAANVLAVGDVIEIVQFWSANNNANAKTATNNIAGGSTINSGTLTNQTSWQTFQHIKITSSTNARSTNQSNTSYAVFSSAIRNSTIDITSTVAINFLGQKATAGDTLILESVRITLMKS